MKAATFALFIGLAYVAAGVLGLVPEALKPPPAEAPAPRFTVLYGYLFGLFPVNLLHSLVHLAIGIWGIVAWRRVASARVYARSLAILYSVLALLGLIPALNTLFGFVPLHGHDVWLHAATAAVASYFGWRPEVERRAEVRTDRREQVVPVADERRHGHPDRRLPSTASSEEI